MTDELNLDDVLRELHGDLQAAAIVLAADDVLAAYEAIEAVLAHALWLDPETKRWREWHAVKRAHETMWAAMRQAHEARSDIDPDVAAVVCHIAAIACTRFTARVDRFDKNRRAAKAIIDGDD